MSYLRDFAEAERLAHPDAYEAAMGRVWFRHLVRNIRFATLDVSAAVDDARDRLEQILA